MDIVLGRFWLSSIVSVVLEQNNDVSVVLRVSLGPFFYLFAGRSRGVVCNAPIQMRNGQDDMVATLTRNAVAEEGRALVSVVIPTHNRAALLKRALQSVLAQTYQNLEIIVVDDASSDATHEVVGDFVDPRIRYIRHEASKGGSGARNTGIRAARGEYIAFLDDDDEWVPEKTREQLSVLDHCDAVLCSCYVNNKSKIKWWPKPVITLEDLKRSPYAIGGTGVLMTKAAILKDLLFDESLPIHQDWDLFIRIRQRCKIAYLNKPLVKYNEGNHARISNRRATAGPEGLERALKMIEKHEQFLGPSWSKRHVAGTLLYGFFRYRKNKFRHFVYTLRRCGSVAIIWVLSKKLYQRLMRL